MNKISIALCTFNGESFLQQQLDSFKIQTTLPDEVVVCDDGSSDSTLEILDNFRRSAPFETRIFSNETNIGYVKNFEQALLRCHGDIVFPSDQDDVWHPDKIETLVGTLKDNPDMQMVVTNAALIDDALSPLEVDLWESFGFLRSEINQFPQNALETLLFGRNFISGNTIAVRSELCSLLTKYPVPVGSAHDHWLGVMAALTSGLAVLNVQSIDYRQHETQIFGAGIGQNKSRRSLLPAAERFAQIAETALAQAKSYQSLIDMVTPITDRPSTGLSELRVDAQNKREQLERKISSLKGQAAHYSARSGLTKSRFRRMPQILKQLKNGSYRQYSSGFNSVFFDLIRK